MEQLTETQIKIHKVARAQFLENGYEKTSLRKIVGQAGFTLGAFYGYYNSKEDLFNALVKDTAEGVIDIISHMGDHLDTFSGEERVANMNPVFEEELPKLLTYLSEHMEETRLLLKCSKGTAYENFLEGIMERNLSSLRKMFGEQLPWNSLTEKLLLNSYFSLLGDAVLSGETMEEVKQTMNQIQAFYAGGMLALTKGNH
ncbi:MAG: TetR/AcrR family transcriptional regulator [Lachnospiraceae bacterium]|nr:TetR/AcrR family transcriptional regulator [Lachnospiraceae bacterium]